MTKDKDLTIAEKFKEQLRVPQTQEVRYIETEDLYPDLGYEDIGSSRGYGPCTSYYCPHTKEELQQQLRQAEAEKDRLKREAKNDIEGFGNKFRQLDKEGEDYRGAVNYIFTSREEIEEAAKGGGFIVHASPFPVSSEIYDGILLGVKKFDENEQRSRARQMYNCAVRKYNEVLEGYNRIKRSYE